MRTAPWFFGANVSELVERVAAPSVGASFGACARWKCRNSKHQTH